MNSELGIRNSELGKCHPERNAVRREVEGSIRLVGALVALVMTFFTACTDYQEEFDNNFAALEYGDIENPELSSGVDPESSHGTTPASSASVSSGADPLSSGTVPASSGAEPLSSGTVPTSSGVGPQSSGAAPASSGTEPQSSGTEPASSSGEPPRSSAESSSSKGYGEVWVCSKIYKTVIIGEQTWMAENMACVTDGSYCYDDSDQNCEKYGRLYNWEAAKTICPDGWHLPDSSEWQTLFDAVGGQENAGKVLKSKAWDGSDKVGFNALPAGYWSFTDKEYKDLGFLAEFWVNDGNGVTIVHLVSSRENAFWYNRSNPEDAYSVRCIKGAKPSSSSSSQSSSSSVKSSSSSQSSSSSAKVYCSGKPYNPETQFCDEKSKIVCNYCNGIMWDPSTQYCNDKEEIVALSECVLKNGEKLLFNPDSQYCDESEGRKNLWNCGGKMIKQEQYCFTTTEAPNTIQVAEKPKCDDELYNRLTHYCHNYQTGGLRKRTICRKNPTAEDSLNIDLRVDSLDAFGHNGQMCDTRDYQIYKTVSIDNETWMAQNMNYQTGNSWCYKDKPENCDKYGRLYDWNTAKSVCPEGWHLPTIGAIDSLIDHAGKYHDNDVEKGLKSTEGWNSPEENGDDYWHFSVIPGGGWDSRFEYQGEGTDADFWSNTEEGSKVWILSIGKKEELKWLGDKDSRLSVRCQKNED